MDSLLRCTGRAVAIRSLCPQLGALHHRFLELDGRQLESGHCSGTIEDVARKIQEHLGVEPGYHTIPKSRDDLLKFHPKREDLPERSLKDSYTTAIVHLESDALMRQRFVHQSNIVRMGRIIEHLDLLAVWICHRHVYVPKLPQGVPLPYTFVTLFIDHAKFLVHKFKPDVDLLLSGHVSWTGFSSMEITTYARQNDETLTKAIFIVVGRNATNSGPAPVNPLKPANELEECFHSEAIERHRRREKQREGSGGCFMQPSREEEKIMFDIFLRTKGSEGTMKGAKLPPDCRWISKWQRSTTVQPFPESRNESNTIFGGFIIRIAMETSFIAACIYSRSHAQIQLMSDVTFAQQIPVQCFMKVTAYVVYTQDKYIQVMTVVNSVNGLNFIEAHTNALHLTYATDHPVPEILPSSFHEALWYMEGRRHLERFLQSMKGESPKEEQSV